MDPGPPLFCCSTSGAPSPDLERQLAVALPEDLLLLLLLLLFLLNLNRDGSFGDSGDLGADVEAVEEDVLSWLPEPSVTFRRWCWCCWWWCSSSLSCR